MMKKIITSPYRKMKILFVLPVFVIILYAFAESEYYYAASTDNKLPEIRHSFSMTTDVKGKVVKQDGTPFTGVTIVVTGTPMGVTTDAAGRFVIGNLPENASLVFSYEGYQTQVVKPDLTSEMTIKMSEDPDYKKQLKIRTGDGSEVRALIVIDGMVSEKGIGQIDPNSILSINILKDKPAIDKYGDKGKEGVIEITTKKKESAVPQDKPQTPATQRQNPVIAVDGVITDKSLEEVRKALGYDMGIIKSLAPVEAAFKYGEKGVNGVIEIITRNKALEMGLNPPFPRLAPEDYPTFQDKQRFAFIDWVVGRVKYPTEAQDKELEDWVSLNFKIGLDGTVSDVVSTNAVDPVLSDEVIRVVRSSPKWEPPKNPGVDEPFTFGITLRFKLPDQILNEAPFIIVEQMPMYPGGESELLNFIGNNIIYPEEAVAGKTEGRVIVRFIVNTDGNAEGLSVLKGAHPLLDAEALRVVGKLSGFSPGMQDGRAVNVWYMVPVNFRLP